MPTGKREVFKIELRLDPAQRRVWSEMEESGKAVQAMALAKLESLHSTGWSMEREMFVNLSLNEASASAGMLKERAVRGLLGTAHDRFTAHVRAMGGPLRRNRGSAPFEIDPEDLVLSSTDPVIAVPYLGMVRILPNNKINAYVNDRRYGPTEDKAGHWSRLKKIELCVWNNRHVLVVDCSGGEVKVTEKGKK